MNQKVASVHNQRSLGMRMSWFAIFAVTISAVIPARADMLIYANGSPNPPNGNEMSQWIQAESFILNAPANIDAIRFWDNELSRGGSYNGSIYYAVASNIFDSPGILLTSALVSSVTRTNTGVSNAGLTMFQNDFTIPNLTLSAGDYWLELHNGPLTSQGRDEFYWTASLPGSGFPPIGHELVAPFDGPWMGNFEEHAFELFGSPIPEPATWLLLSTVLLAVTYRVRTQRQS